METSFILTRLLGLYYVSVALGVMLNFKTYEKIMEDFFKNESLIFFSGIIAVIFGLLMIEFHNIWATDWQLIITVTGWLALMKGIGRIFFPRSVSKVMKSCLKNPLLMKILMFIVLGLRLTLSAIGYQIL